MAVIADHPDQSKIDPHQPIHDQDVAAAVIFPSVADQTLTGADQTLTERSEIGDPAPPAACWEPMDFTADDCPAFVDDESLSVSWADARRSIEELCPDPEPLRSRP